MAAALLRARLEHAGVEAIVRSAGVAAFDGLPPVREAVRVMAEHGLDTSGHRSRSLARSELETADLVLAMTRGHLREAVLVEPTVWPRAFTLKELVRRAEREGPRASREPFAAWLARVHDGRQLSDLLGESDEDDVADPIGLGLYHCRDTAADLTALVDRLVLLARLDATWVPLD